MIGLALTTLETIAQKTASGPAKADPKEQYGDE
jgi:hypothetical protein